MSPEELKKLYGEDYPAAVIRDGDRMPLHCETRFCRHYRSENKKIGTTVSRFMDGSATITLAELERDWPTLTDSERTDFCQECSWLHKQADFPEILRFVMKRGSLGQWSAIALSIPRLPQQEAFDFLTDALATAEIGRASNLGQAIGITKHREAEPVLRRRLDQVWHHKSLWEDDTFTNWPAFEATTCIAHLIELGADAKDFEDKVRELSQHVCNGNRKSCRNFLGKYYPWLA